MDHPELKAQNIYIYMSIAKKRPSKKAKAAKKAVDESKLLAAARAEHDAQDEQNFRTPEPSPRTSGPNKRRPNKKRG
jgi:hypothetical protein